MYDLILQKHHLYYVYQNNQKQVFYIEDISPTHHDYPVCSICLYPKKINYQNKKIWWNLEVSADFFELIGHKDLYPEYFI